MKLSLKWVNVAVIFSSSVVLANDPFAELDAEMAQFETQRGNSQQVQSEFEQYLQAEQSDYQVWQQEYLQEFDQFQQQVINKWGKAEPIKAEYDVEFTEDKNVKSVIDYESEEVKVELIVDNNLSQADAEKAVKAQFEKLLADKESNIAKVMGLLFQSTPVLLKI